ncbi:MAG: signal peptidase II [Candidatus Glassbacteria bacterium RBG_16_58_8]|uniref:Lipoprotein signal peptidase n=1 Tax=Candidatus Glassbacteria bacterium RBG_16_58_8 TaxID=1817866 RepID=A0A1F5YD94_9BACT|nr:MAG: signal peptidase II [Candidatus Glassbacteria bacterium RBG_16_58_8]
MLFSSLFAFLDQFTKALAIIYLTPHRPQSVLGTFVQFTLIRNRGAAFGISFGSNSEFFLLVLSSLAIVLIVLYYIRSSPSGICQHLSFGLISGGAVGNTIDRIAKGEVVDFIDCGVGGLRWPIFNVADIAVTLGALILLVHSFTRSSHRPPG